MTSVNCIAIKGLSAAVPETVARNADLTSIYGPALAKVIELTGVEQRRVAKSLCTSDLCYAAAESLLDEMRFDRSQIDAIVFLSQTTDHLLPATSCLLQRRLGLSTTCAAFDMALGCSGYVYGLWVAASLLAAGQMRNVLLLVGDTTSRLVSPEDRSVALLFGDAGSATLLSRDESAKPMHFELGSDGTGGKNLIVPAGGFRTPATSERLVRSEREGGGIRSDADLYMNGGEIFTFSMTAVPKLVDRLLSAAGASSDAVDSYVFHQASKVILEHLRKRMKLPREKVLNTVKGFGNTSSTSLPLAMVDALQGRLRTESMKHVLAAFGVGYSWGAALVETDRIVVPGLRIVAESEAAVPPN